MNRKQLVGRLAVLSMLAVFGVAMARPESDAAASRMITVLNPAVTEKLVARAPLAPRLAALEGKTIYLVDMNYEGFGRTEVIYEMQRWFAKNMPGVKTIVKLKGGNYASDDPGLWKEIAANKGDGVILGVAG